MINEERSYTEYNVEVPTTDFPIGFDILDGGIDVVAVTLNDVDPTTLGYTVIQVNNTTYRFAPAVPSGVIRLTRITDIDQMVHVFTEGAIFISENMDGNFKQIRHSQQEVRDSFEKLELEVDAAVVVSNNAAELALEASVLANSASELAAQASNDVIDTNTIVQTSGEVNVTLSDGSVVPNMNKRIADYGTKVLSVNGEVGAVVVNAENLPTLNGSTQQDINDRGGATWYTKSGGYNLNYRVILDNGDIVRSTEPNNTVDPNIDMTGWLFDKQSGLSVIDFSAMWGKSTSIDARAMLQTAVDLTPDGGVLIIPFDIYFEGTVTCKNKNINIYSYGKIYWKPNGTGKAFVFSRDDYIDIQGSTLSVLPKKGDYKLNFTTPPPQIAQPSDYFVNLISTENEIFRLDFDMYYQKHHTNAVVASDYTLRGNVITDFTDASKLKLRFVKKGIPVEHVGLNIMPTEKITSGSLNYVEYLHTSNIVRKNWMIYSSGKQRAGQQVAFNHCYNIDSENCHIYGANATDSDSYAFVQFNSAWLSFKKCAYYDADGTAKRSRGLAGRHGYRITVDNCLFMGVDDHWGHDYVLRDMVLANALGLSGGGAYLENITALERMFSGRNDTPYNDGKLIMRNCKCYGVLIDTQRANYPNQFTRYKLFDEIDIECDVYTSGKTIAQIIKTTDASDLDESFHNTIGRFKLRVFQDSDNIIPIWANGYSPYNQTLDGNREEARLFKKLDIDVDHIIKDTGSYSTDKQVLYGVCSDEINIEVSGGFSCSQVRANKVNFNKSEIGFNGSVSSGTIKANEIRVDDSKLNQYAQTFTHGTFTPKIHLRNNEFANWSKFDSFVWGNIQTAYGNYTLIDTDRATVSVNRNYHNYDKSKQARYVFTSDVVISGNGTSIEYSVSMGAYSPTDMVIASLDFWTFGVYVEQIDQGNTNGTIRFRLRNLTASDITVAAGRSVTLKIA